MQKLEIDYSEIPAPISELPQEDWEPPVHKYFGKKGANGKMEKEPVYVHQEYPRMMYSLKENKIVAKIVQNEAQRNALGDGWETTPGAFGYLTAPSFEESVSMKDPRKEVQAEPARVGRPPKAA